MLVVALKAWTCYREFLVGLPLSVFKCKLVLAVICCLSHERRCPYKFFIPWSIQ